MKRVVLAYVFVLAYGVSPAWAQNDYTRGYNAGKAACANGPSSAVPGIHNSPEFTQGWQRGCSEALSAYFYRKGYDEGYRACQTNPSATSPNPTNLDYTRGFMEGCRLAPKPQPKPDPKPQVKEVKVASLDPAAGSAGGGTRITIMGEGFTGATAVKFGAVAAAAFTVASDAHITSTAPAGAAGAVPVTVTAGGKTSAAHAAAQFTYRMAADPSPPQTPPPLSGGNAVTGINCNDPEIPRTWKAGAGCPGYGTNLPQTPPESSPPAQDGRNLVNGINCNDPEIPRTWKAGAGCPGYGTNPPQSTPPAQPQTPPESSPPAQDGRNLVNGINCNDPDIPLTWKAGAGCPGYATSPPAAPMPPQAQPHPPVIDPVAAPPVNLQPGLGSIVGVTLTLRFRLTESIGGFTGQMIIPAEFARDYRHRQPPPPGAIQGQAWLIGPNTVRLNTNRLSGLEAGRQYVVFLMYTGETAPVAVLDLPETDADFTAEIDATLDRASVLARIRR
jgi:hypothetical protein